MLSAQKDLRWMTASKATRLLTAGWGTPCPWLLGSAGSSCGCRGHRGPQAGWECWGHSAWLPREMGNVCCRSASLCSLSVLWVCSWLLRTSWQVDGEGAVSRRKVKAVLGKSCWEGGLAYWYSRQVAAFKIIFFSLQQVSSPSPPPATTAQGQGRHSTSRAAPLEHNWDKCAYN